jgi:hypothetical protein
VVSLPHASRAAPNNFSRNASTGLLVSTLVAGAEVFRFAIAPEDVFESPEGVFAHSCKLE